MKSYEKNEIQVLKIKMEKHIKNYKRKQKTCNLVF